MVSYDYIWNVEDITQWLYLYFFGDQHYGARDCAVNDMKAVIEEIASNPHARCVLMGDSCDFINFSDKRFDVKQVEPDFIPDLDNLPRAMAMRFVELCVPLQSKIICMIPGNHDDEIRMRYHFDVAGYIAGLLNVPLLSHVSQLRIFVREPSDQKRRRDWPAYKIKGVLSHAQKGAITVGGKLTASIRIADFFGDHDFFAQAHTHEYLVHEGRNLDVAGSPGNPRTIERPRMTFLTGGFLKTYGDGPAGYGEKRGYRPCRLGSPRLEMRLVRTSRVDHNRAHKSCNRVELRGH